MPTLSPHFPVVLEALGMHAKAVVDKVHEMKGERPTKKQKA